MQNDDRVNSILREEFEKALRGLKANKAPGVDLIAAKLLQNLGQAERIILFKIVCDFLHLFCTSFLSLLYCVLPCSSSILVTSSLNDQFYCFFIYPRFSRCSCFFLLLLLPTSSVTFRILCLLVFHLSLILLTQLSPALKNP